MSKNIIVIGSMNMDLVFETDQSPERGETLTGRNFMTTPGGKGANQACAVGKLGGDVCFISARGDDGFGSEIVKSLSDNNVNVKNVYCTKKHTGTAGIIVEKCGDNRIIVIPGANDCVTPENVLEKENLIKKAGFMLLQMEIPLESVICAVELAHKHNLKIILDPAPAQKLPEHVYSKIDYLLPNEGELEMLFEDYNLPTTDSKIEKLLELGVKNVLVTLGENGCKLINTKGEKLYRGLRVKAVDTTAAGDTFAGAFAYGLQQNMTEEKSIKFAMAAAALSVTKSGAQISMPTLDEVTAFVNDK